MSLTFLTDQPFVFYVNRELHLFDSMNANDSTLEPHITEEQFEKYHDDQDFEPCSLEPPTMIRQRFLAFRRMSVNEDSCPMWTFDTADEFNSEAKADDALAVQILVGFDNASATTNMEDDTANIQSDQEFFDTATCFKVAPLTQVSEGWIGLEIEQTVFCNNDDPSLLSDNEESDSDQEEQQRRQQQHPLTHWGFEMIQRVFDSLNSDGIVDIHSDTASIGGPSPHQSPGLSPSDKDSFQYSCDMTSNSLRHSEMSQPRAKIHKPSTSFLIMNKHPDEHCHGGSLPSYLARIWNIIFEYMDDSKAADVSKLLADPKSASTAYPFSAKFATLLGRSQQHTPEQQEYHQENSTEDQHHAPYLTENHQMDDDGDDETAIDQEPAILKIANAGQAPTTQYRSSLEDQHDSNESDDNSTELEGDEHHHRYSTSDSSEDEDNALNNVQQAIGYYPSDPNSVPDNTGDQEEPVHQYHERLLPVVDDDTTAMYASDSPLDDENEGHVDTPEDEEEASIQDMPVEEESRPLTDDNDNHDDSGVS